MKDLFTLEQIDLNKKLRNIELDDEKALMLAMHIVKNEVGIIRESNEIDEIQSEVSESTRQYLKDIRENNDINNIDDKRYRELFNVGIEKLVEYAKKDYVFVELINELYLLITTFISKYYDTLLTKYDSKKIEEFFSIFVTIKLTATQLEYEQEEYNAKLAFILYAKIKYLEDEGKSISEILDILDISYEYYQSLLEIYEDIDLELDVDIDDYIETIEEEFEYDSLCYKFNYIESKVLVMYLLGEDITGYEDVFDRVLRKISENE